MTDMWPQRRSVLGPPAELLYCCMLHRLWSVL